MVAEKRELIRAALKVLSAHVDRRRADPKDISLFRGGLGGWPLRRFSRFEVPDLSRASDEARHYELTKCCERAVWKGARVCRLRSKSARNVRTSSGIRAGW